MAIQENPYLPPASRVEDAEIVRGDYVEGGRTVPLGHGWDWIATGWGIFRREPGTWILIAFVLGIIFIATSLVPFVGSFATPVLMPIFIGGLMLTCVKIERAAGITLTDLFSGFDKSGGPLAIFGLIGLGLFVAASIPALLLLFAVAFGDWNKLAGAILIFMLVYFAILVPVYMALWFGPALISLQDMAPSRALGQSFRGCLRNVLPFLVYGAILFVLAVVATLPLGLGWLVLGPVIVASTYAAYRDIYFEG